MRSQHPPRLHAGRFGGLVVALGLAIAPLLYAVPALGAEDKVEILSVTASSTDGMLMDAVDGDMGTAWQNKRAGEATAWLGVHFADSADLTGMRLFLDPLGNDTMIDVETSTDGEHYTPQQRGMHATKDRLELHFAKTVTAAYLRVRFRYTGTKAAPRFRIKELEALGS